MFWRDFLTLYDKQIEFIHTLMLELDVGQNWYYFVMPAVEQGTSNTKFMGLIQTEGMN